MTTRLAGVIALAALALVGAGVAFTLTRPSSGQSTSVAGNFHGSEPPPGIHIPAFRLDSYRGEEVRSSELRGKVVLVTFLDTACREKCPIIAARIFDRGGIWVSTLHAGVDLTPMNLAHDIRVALRPK